jgi:hypothetical protein
VGQEKTTGLRPTVILQTGEVRPDALIGPEGADDRRLVVRADSTEEIQKRRKGKFFSRDQG